VVFDGHGTASQTGTEKSCDGINKEKRKKKRETGKGATEGAGGGEVGPVCACVCGGDG